MATPYLSMNEFTNPIGCSSTRFAYLLWVLPLLLSSSVNAQTYMVWGKVYANHMWLPGVKVVINRSGQEAVTDEHGEFKLSVLSQDTLKLMHPNFPTRDYILPVLTNAINFYFDVATNNGSWKNYREEDRKDDPSPQPSIDEKQKSMQSFGVVPAPSSKVVLDARFFVNANTLAQADQRLNAALKKSGYPDPGYYYIPGGFAMVGQIEQTERDGTPKPQPARFPPRLEGTSAQFNLSSYLQMLYKATTGYYRVIIFFVTNRPLDKSVEPVNPEMAKAWYLRGGDFLPSDIGKQAFTKDHRVLAYIYEFEKPENSKARFLSQGNCLGQVHLSKSKIIDSLTR